MSKATPNPRNADDASAHEKIDPQKPDEATQSLADEDLLSNADIRATRRTPPTMFIVNPDVHVIDLLGSVSESLASASVITLDVADRETGTSRNSLLGIAQLVMLAEISVNRALGQLDPHAPQ
ncbi:hypothetical protein QIW53_20950 [Pseudomonas fluorescens]|uniref:DUF6124 family protein n=1 Tax=Pseudomonas fluorescens TaxID=294 RepID=UPI0035240E7B